MTIMDINAITPAESHTEVPSNLNRQYTFNAS